MVKDLKLVTNLKVKGIDDNDDIIIEGIANGTNEDRVGDIILESAWTNKEALSNYLKNPILLAFHDHKQPIGKTIGHTVDNKGLHITGKITKSAGNVYNLVKDEILSAFSVGFRVKDAEYDVDTDIFVIKELELHEISVVSVPAQQDSLFSIAKAFDNDEDYKDFKNSFVNKENIEDTIQASNTETIMSKETLKDVINLTPEALQEKMDAAVALAFKDAEAKADAEKLAKAASVEAGKEGAAALIEELTAKMADEKAEMAKTIETFSADLKEKSAEIEAMTKSKMSFNQDDSRKLTDLEVDTAVLVAKMVGKSITDTDYFKKTILEKVGDHLTGTTGDAYETMFSTRMYDAIKDKLVIEPLFRNKISMNSRSMVFPFNPQAGFANWVTDAEYKSSVNPSDDGTVDAANGSSSGITRNHPISDISLKAEKLASKEAIGYEEDEDSIIPIIPIVQNAIAERMSRTTDIELLRGDSGVAHTGATANIGTSLINGVSTLAADNSTEFVQPSAFGTPITVADLQATRRKMGSYGLNPRDVVYVVSESAYYDLLEDDDFRTADLVGGQNATILTGQIGSVNGSSVVVSDSFVAPAVNGVAAIAINVSNYLFGELRGLNTERSVDVLNQKNWIVTTRRFAFNTIAAADTSCANLVYAAA